jgi:hypothetical protein
VKAPQIKSWIRPSVHVVVAVLALMPGNFAWSQSAADALGRWQGTLQTGAGDLPLVLTITRNADGALAASLESPSQAPGLQIPVTSIAVVDGRLTFQSAPLRASFEGKWVAGKQQWQGTFTQGVALPLTLARQ